MSEIKQDGEKNVNATQIHHIFPASDFPAISDYLENLIALTPNQHYSYAHPSNKTAYIDKDFQYICLLAKTNTIQNDKATIYNFDDYKFVLNTGLNTNEFDEISEFSTLISKIDYFYSDFNENKFPNLAKINRPNDF